MQAELKAYCVHCGGGMEFPEDMQGEKIVCPHCHKLTTLGIPKATPPLPVQQQPMSVTPVQDLRFGKIKSQSEIAGSGCLVQVLAICVIWLWPIGTIMGIALFFIGSGMSRKLVCSECGKDLTSRRIKICPACHANFTR